MVYVTFREKLNLLWFMSHLGKTGKAKFTMVYVSFREKQNLIWFMSHSGKAKFTRIMSHLWKKQKFL